jgi:hypothetical protein
MDDSADHNGKTLAKTGNVVLRGVAIVIDTDVGQQFVTDCARHTEDFLSESEIKSKWALSDEDWVGLAANTPFAPSGSSGA